MQLAAPVRSPVRCSQVSSRLRGPRIEHMIGALARVVCKLDVPYFSGKANGLKCEMLLKRHQ